MTKYIFIAEEDIPIVQCPDLYKEQDSIGVFKKGQELESFRNYLGKMTSICDGIYYKGWIDSKHLVLKYTIED
ncbi:MAG: hypothetical protein WC503_06115 [Candidatus Shapirobacteria bacterium]